MILVARRGAMKQVGYVNQAGQPIVHKQIDPKKASIAVGGILLIVMIVVFIFITVKKSNKNKTCNRIEDIYINEALSYAKEKDLLPTIETESITINGNDLREAGRVSQSETMLGKNQCEATITITRHEEDYLKSVNLKNCGYCTTDERYGGWKESKKLPKNSAVIELDPTFNYYDTTDYYTNWTDFLEPERISKKVSKEYGVALPIDEDILPEVPSTGHIVKIEKEDKTYYSYRDKLWRYYANPNGNYSAFSSTKPSGYANKDEDSSRETDWSEWSLNYPDEADYRTIDQTIGYRWYYKEKGKKIYWKSGEYSPEQPSKKYNKKEKEARMYRYRDIQWRWYNGSPRQYTSMSRERYENYPYRDEETLVIDTWSGWEDTSYYNAENSYYREQRTTQYSRYRIKYQVYSLLKLESFVDKATFEQQVGKPYQEFVKTPNVKVEVEYRYRYRKAK